MSAKWIAAYVLTIILGTSYLGLKAYKAVKKLGEIQRTPQNYTPEGDEMLSQYLLSAHLAMTPTPQQNQQDEALRYVGKAFYVQLGIDAYVKNIEKRYIPDDIRPYVAYTGTVVRILQEKRITYTWSF